MWWIINNVLCIMYSKFHSILDPPPPLLFTCSLADDAQSVTFLWNSSMDVDHYCVNTSPSVTGCSMCTIPPGNPFICSGLQLGQQYSIHLMGVNCNDQEGDRETVMINLTSMPKSVLSLSVYTCT